MSHSRRGDSMIQSAVTAATALFIALLSAGILVGEFPQAGIDPSVLVTLAYGARGVAVIATLSVAVLRR